MKYLLWAGVLFCLSGCVSTPYANIGAHKTVNVGGVDVGIGVGNIFTP